MDFPVFSSGIQEKIKPLPFYIKPVIISEIISGSQTEGLLQMGDVLCQYNGRDLNENTDFEKCLEMDKSKKVKLKYYRDGVYYEITIKGGETGIVLFKPDDRFIRKKY